ncbi:hypothetical protein JCM21714_2087 [Gracilibacillus boraciitolerans JCM 21714]|uniref:Uncharacterized protein n=1 Tax=Gracilibacillus boraciitolerans JCM 21714 TaxID=1298598 RepID=W4VIL3_9BACI|nr:hypothetical protein [Gracilibacillus boraciitolerans]GAE93052.1 hypothetical protein JCM21714_2087 [Gracilibacillus boraciitolerans JCM 21714]
MKKITYIILSFLIISFCFIQPIHIKAVEVDAKSNTEINYQETNDEFFTSSFGEYQNEKVYYSIDFIDSSELEEEGFIDGLNPFKQAKDGAENLVFELIHNLVIELPFTVLKTATVALIWLLNSVSLLNFINIMIDEIESTVIAMTGINNLSFGSSGLFGGFLSLIILFIAVYTLFMFVIKKRK